MPATSAAQFLRQPARQRQRALDQLLQAPDVGVDFERALGRVPAAGATVARSDAPVRVTQLGASRASALRR